MPNQHKTPLVGWHPPADLLARLQALTERRQLAPNDGTRSVILNAALRHYLDPAEGKES